MFLFIPRQKFHFPTLCQSVKLFPPSSTFVPFVIQSCNNYWQTETIFVQRNYVTCAKKDSFFFFSFFHERSLFNWNEKNLVENWNYPLYKGETRRKGREVFAEEIGNVCDGMPC